MNNELRNVTMSSTEASFAAGLIYIRKMLKDPFYKNVVFDGAGISQYDEENDAAISVSTNLTDDEISALIEICNGRNSDPVIYKVNVFPHDGNEWETDDIFRACDHTQDDIHDVAVCIHDDDNGRKLKKFEAWVKEASEAQEVKICEVSDEYNDGYGNDKKIRYLAMGQYIESSVGTRQNNDDIMSTNNVLVFRTNLHPLYLAEIADCFSYGCTVRY